MELTSFYEYIKNTSTGGAVLTEHLLPGPNRRSQTPERTRKVSIQLGRMKGGKGKWDISWVSGRELKRGNVPDLWEAPSPVGSSEMELQRLRGEPSCQPAADRAERPARTVQPPAWAPSLRHKSAATDRGWVLRLGVQRPGLGRGMELAAQR